MIFDTLERAKEYVGLHPMLDVALGQVSSLAERPELSGRIEMEEGRLYANCMQYETSSDPDRLWEAHRDYIDIHVVTGGRELVQFAKSADATVERPYDQGIDAELYHAIPTASVELQKGFFAIFCPGEIHRAGASVHIEAQRVSKFVVKVNVSQEKK